MARGNDHVLGQRVLIIEAIGDGVSGLALAIWLATR